MKLYDIIVKEKQEQHLPSSKKEVPLSEEKPVLISDPIPTHTRRKKIVVFLLILAILVMLYIVGFWIQYAKITVHERSIPFTLTNAMFDLAHEESTEFTSPYTFQTITVESEIEREVIGTEFKQVTEYSRGLVVFSNEWSKTAESIKLGTVIESPNGKKYKTTSSISVPGYTLSGTQKNPGISKPVSVIALEPGTASNNPGTTFTIPSFASKKRQAFFAKSVGPLVGGDSGVRHSLSPDEENTTIQALAAQLKERLRRETRAQVPEEFFISSQMQYEYIDTDTFELEGDSIKFTAKAQGRLVSYLLRREVLYRLLAEEVIKDKKDGQFYITDLSRLNFEIISPIPINSESIPDQIRIRINGTGTLIAKVDTEELRKDITGISVKQFKEYISKKSTVEKAEISLLPFWSPNLPRSNKLLRITVK